MERHMYFGSWGPLSIYRPNSTTYSLIDVEQCCIVGDVGEPSWVALSYICGKRPFQPLLFNQLTELKKLGALSEDVVPLTVADATILTRAIGEKHLWVESFCIIQDSISDKMELLSIEAIFGLATLTIVDAARTDAFSGHTGFHPKTRHQKQKPL
ncbi:hypothetical protein BBP40_003631 [Aspergillus hancockii]|nr:hypothetical protein BBP40_003631 [Aspergillus hancockii]